MADLSLWWRHTESLAPVDVDRMTAVLSDDERRRLGRFIFERDRRDFAAAHALVRHALSSCDATSPGDWRFEPDERGKPHIHPQHPAAGSLAFNLSHTRGLVACAIARRARIGIDVEQISRVVDARLIASRHFARSELEFLERCGPSEYGARFIELWTLKEAFVKAVGGGFQVPLDTCRFEFDGASGLRFSGCFGSDGWEFLLAAPSEGTRLAVAVRRTDSEPGVAWRVHIGTPPDGAETGPVLLRWSSMIDHCSFVKTRVA